MCLIFPGQQLCSWLKSRPGGGWGGGGGVAASLRLPPQLGSGPPALPQREQVSHWLACVFNRSLFSFQSSLDKYMQRILLLSVYILIYPPGPKSIFNDTRQPSFKIKNRMNKHCHLYFLKHLHKSDIHICSLSLWRVARGSKHMFLELIHGLFIT